MRSLHRKFCARALRCVLFLPLKARLMQDVTYLARSAPQAGLNRVMDLVRSTTLLEDTTS